LYNSSWSVVKLGDACATFAVFYCNSFATFMAWLLELFGVVVLWCWFLRTCAAYPWWVSWFVGDTHLDVCLIYTWELVYKNITGFFCSGIGYFLLQPKGVSVGFTPISPLVVPCSHCSMDHGSRLAGVVLFIVRYPSATSRSVYTHTASRTHTA
jgi:hypothetical protein